MKLSPVMSKALDRIQKAGGYTVRTAGGYWWPGEVRSHWFGTSTVAALVKRGVLNYTEWKEGHNYKFPIRADLVALQDPQEPS
jgi:hypothetical protein